MVNDMTDKFELIKLTTEPINMLKIIEVNLDPPNVPGNVGKAMIIFPVLKRDLDSGTIMQVFEMCKTVWVMN